MFPYIDFGPVHLGTFGLLLWLAAVVATVVLHKNFVRNGVDADALNIVAFVVIAGVLGAKVWHELQNPADLHARVWQIVAPGWKHPLDVAMEFLHWFQAGFAWFGGMLAGIADADVAWDGWRDSGCRKVLTGEAGRTRCGCWTWLLRRRRSAMAWDGSAACSRAMATTESRRRCRGECTWARCAGAPTRQMLWCSRRRCTSCCIRVGAGMVVVAAQDEEPTSGKRDHGRVPGTEWDRTVSGGVCANQSETVLGHEQRAGSGVGSVAAGCCADRGGAAKNVQWTPELAENLRSN